MRRTMNIWVLIVACAFVLIGFFWYNHSLQASLDEVTAQYNAQQAKLSQQESRQTELDAMLDTVGTDVFIENQARTLYDYMMPDEILFQIDNPEALYGPDGMPSS